VLRLLVVDGGRVVTRAQFLDYHEPLRGAGVARPMRAFAYSNFVVRGLVDPPQWEEYRGNGFELALYVDWSKFSTFEGYEAFILSCNRGMIREFDAAAAVSRSRLRRYFIVAVLRKLYWILMFKALISAPYFSLSALICAANASGVDL
jgi:hypothetical protein